MAGRNGEVEDEAETETKFINQPTNYGSVPGPETDSSSMRSHSTGEHLATSKSEGTCNIQETESFSSTTYLRRNLRLFLYSPCKLKKANGKYTCYIHVLFFVFMMLQMVKTGFITAQLITVGNYRRYFQDLVDSGYTTIEHLLLQNWSSELETPPYPPSHGPYAVYKRKDLIEHMNYVVENYYTFENEGIGIYPSMNKTDAVTICIKYFEFEQVSPDHERSNKQPVIKEPCFDSKLNADGSYSIEEDVRGNNISEDAAFERFLSITASFKFNSLRLSMDQTSGQCLQIDGKISFTDDKNSGKALVVLDTITTQLKCRLIGVNLKDVCLLEDMFPLAVTILVLSIGSVLVIISEGCPLICLIKKYMNMPNGRNDAENTKTISHCNSICQLLKAKWSLLFQLCGDVLIIWDSACTVFLYSKAACNEEDGEQRLGDLDQHAVRLGAGCFLCWMTLTRYLNIQRRFSILFRTIKNAFLSVIFYLFGVTVMFVGFALCGYIVFGPYHNKFQSFQYTVSTLISIINGDEIFATWANLEVNKAGNESLLAIVYAVYIFLYVFMFAAIVFNILIAIFTSAYDEVQKRYDGKHRFLLQRTIDKILTTENVPADLRKDLTNLLLRIQPYIEQGVDDDQDDSENVNLISLMGKGEKDKELFKTCSKCCITCIFPLKRHSTYHPLNHTQNTT